MNEGENILAWLEQTTGGRVPILGTCSIGRLSSNTIMLADERVSRRHALINVQGQDEFWLVDLGSGNGTYLNGRRVAQPTRLRDGDRIEIAAFQLSFHQAESGPAAAQLAIPEPADGEKTLQQIKSADCWLLVADIEASTQLMHKLSESTLPATGHWLDECKQLIEKTGGSINKFLGDGFFAYWRQNPATEESVLNALETLARMQRAMNPRFRVVLHFGQVFTGGAASLGEESLQGKEVHFVFRMEKLAGSIGERCLISETAKSRLPARVGFTEAGSHAVAGFEGERPFYTMAR